MKATYNTYTQGTATVQVAVPEFTPTGTEQALYAFADGNELVASGALTSAEFAMLTDPSKGRSESTIAEHVYDWLV